MVVSDSPLVRSLMRIAKITRIHFNDTVREAGAQAGQDELFTVLSADTPTNVSEAAKRLRVRSATVSRMLDRLSKRGLVKRIVIVVGSGSFLPPRAPKFSDEFTTFGAVWRKTFWAIYRIPRPKILRKA